MFDPDLYRKACSESLRLSDETLEEMIFMTEKKRRGLRRPVRIALTAAALAAVMCVTAAAANPEAVEELWKSFTVSVIYQDENTMVVQAELPQINVTQEGERVILDIDGAKTDITDALERDGVCVQSFETENGTAELTVQKDLTWGLMMPLEDDVMCSYNSSDVADVEYSANLGDVLENFDTFTFTDDETRTDAIYLPPEE